MGSVCLLLRHHMANEPAQPMAASGRARKALGLEVYGATHAFIPMHWRKVMMKRVAYVVCTRPHIVHGAHRRGFFGVPGVRYRTDIDPPPG